MSVELGMDEWCRQGFHVAREVLTAQQLGKVRDLEFAAKELRCANERKGLWVVEPTVRDMATSEIICRHLDIFFGGDGYFLWGAQVVDRQPDEIHPWHSDLETSHSADGFVSLWIPISGVSMSNTLRSIAGSHRYGSAVQSHFRWGDPARSDPDATRLLEQALRQDAEAVVSTSDCGDGDGVFFHGALWHGTFNHRDVSRRALLLQYGRHGAAVRLVEDRTLYPPRLNEAQPPAVLPIRGQHDPVTNYNLLPRGNAVAYPPARLARRPSLVKTERQPWKRVTYFKTATPVSRVMICHASELMPGFMPHLPHRHTREELLIVLGGKATIYTQDSNGGVLRSIQAAPGDLFYYPKGHAHTITNSGDGPLKYLMFRWTARAVATDGATAFHYRPAEYSAKSERFSVDRDSSALHHLHIHFTRLRPGEAFPSHIDLYDTGIVVLQGSLSMLEYELGPGGVFFVRAGELHNTRNESDEPCEYIVFEFHAHC